MPTLPTADLTFTLRLARRGLNVEFLGPTLRGLLGYGLRDIACPHASDPHGHCACPQACNYAYLFEGVPPFTLGSHRALYSAVPQPFTLLVDPISIAAKARDAVTFCVRLFGVRAIELAPLVVSAIESRTAHGIGSTQTPFHIEHVALSARHHIELRAPLSDIDLTRRSVLKWTFETPVSLRAAHRFVTNVSAVDIMKAGRLRSWLLARCYGDEAARAMRAPDEVHSRAFRTLHSDLTPWRIRRQSGRQQRAVNLEGVVGSIEIEGAWERERWWTQGISMVHLGKYATFGLGRVSCARKAVESTTWGERSEGEHSDIVGEQERKTDKPTGRPARVPRWIQLRGFPPKPGCQSARSTA